jgi:hypothetical protein
LTTEAGRSTTSPAAIWLMTFSGSGLILLMINLYRLSDCGCQRGMFQLGEEII